MNFTSITKMAMVCAALSAGTVASGAVAPQCELNRPVRFGGMNWDTNLVLVEVQRAILKKGYGCRSETLPAETLPALAALVRGNLDVNTEVWLNSVSEPWARAEKTGRVQRVGRLYTGGEGWFIPRYTAERLPGLKKASDLAAYKNQFKDREEPTKGRFYGCPAGWGCEVVATNLFHALKLEDSFTLYSPGTGAAQKAALTAAYKRRQNIAFYYWYPTRLAGSMDIVRLELPVFDAEKHACLTALSCASPQPTEYPENPVFTALNSTFMQQAPKLTTFFSRMEIPLPVIDELLARMQKHGSDSKTMAAWFLKTKAEVWTKWLPADVAERVHLSL
jgi:glycine betaine/proline transport system substrate-binding protein